jgi:hypothetical protein
MGNSIGGRAATINKLAMVDQRTVIAGDDDQLHGSPNAFQFDPAHLERMELE